MHTGCLDGSRNFRSTLWCDCRSRFKPNHEGLKFTGINTTSLLILDLGRPDIVGEFTVGDDETSLVGSAIQAYGAGSVLQPLMIDSPVF